MFGGKRVISLSLDLFRRCKVVFLELFRSLLERSFGIVGGEELGELWRFWS